MVGGRSGFPPTRLSITQRAGDELGVRLMLAGEVDLSSVGVLVEALAAVPPAARGVVVDLGELTLLDSTGIAALVAGHRTASAIGQTFTVVNARDVVRRALEVTGVFDFLSP
jgi:stage II sporulation protein AA (anti-sigma F factor antagonist)